MNTPCHLHHLIPTVNPSFPLPSPEDAPQPTGRPGSASCGVTAPPCVPGCTRHCVHLPKVTCLFPPVLWSSFYKAPLACQVNSSGGSSFWCQIPRVGSLLWGLKLSFLFENFCDVIISPSLWVTHLKRYGIWLYHDFTPPTVSLWFLLYVFRCRIFWDSFQSFYWWLFSS